MATDHPKAHAYLFEAKGIQRYVFDSGQLRDVVGASDLVDNLCGSDGDNLLSEVAHAAVGPFTFSRRASAAFTAHGEKDALNRLRALWRLTFAISRPGLEGADGAPADGDNAIDARNKAYEGRSGARFNGAAELLPSGHPFVVFAPRTGRVATGLRVYPTQGGGGDVAADGIHRLDVMTNAQRRWADTQRERGPADRAMTTHSAKSFVFPRNFDRFDEDTERNPLFPFRGDDRRIAIIHADLSGLGETFASASGRARSESELLEVADAIEAAVLDAVQQSLEVAFEVAEDRGRQDNRNVVPARPIVIGGDDLTFILRADIALGFTTTLLESLERTTQARFSAMNKAHLPPALSACAGVAIVGAGHPFLMANTLAEGLCSFAKKAAKEATTHTQRSQARYPSLFAFHVTSTAVHESYEEIFAREMTARTVRLTGNPYRVGNWEGAVNVTEWKKLHEVSAALAAAPRGSGKVIEALRMLRTDSVGAAALWDRWVEVAKRDEEAEHFERLAKALGLSDNPSDSLDAFAGLLADALEAVDVGTCDRVAS